MAAHCRAKTMPQNSKSLAKPRLTHHLPPLLLSIVFLISVTGRIEAAGNDVISVAAANAAETSTLRRPMILRMKREINAMNMDDDDNDNDNDEDDNGGGGGDNDDEEATLTDTEQQQHSKQTTQKADRDFDFAAYINDFNLQEEASIPEDIFDQHDGDIEDAASVPTADDESDADIILESQRPTSRNFSVYLETAKKYPKNNYKLRNNKEANTKSTTNVSNGQRENEKGNGKAKEQTDANFGRKSFAYKKLKNMHEQKQQQQQEQQKQKYDEEDEKEDELDKEMEEQELEQEQEQAQEEEENEEEIEKHQRRQLFDSIEIFNERKFNKPSVDENHDEIEKEPETEQLHEEDGDILAIGDIEDNFSNSNDEVADNVDNDKLAATSIPTTTTTTASPTSTASSTTTTTTRDTITTTTPSTFIPFIGKKLKRRYYDLGHMQSKPTETSADKENVKMKDNHQDLTLGELHYYDATQNLEHKLPNYFGRTLTKKNRTNIERFVDDDYSEQEPPQDMDKQQNEASIADLYYQEDAMTTTTAAVPPLEATTTTTTQPQYSSYPYMYTQTSSYSTPSPSAFERFKALRRSNHRNGHKSHKKRYKDYLRHHSAANEMVSKHMQKLRKEQQQQQQQEAPHAAPIFALGLRPQRPTIVTPKPFYEGQVNYYDQAQDNDSNEDLEHHTEMQRLIAHDNGNWYRRISPVLRNGIKSNANNGAEQLPSSANSLSLRHHVKQLEPPHHHPYHHQAHQHHHHHHSHHQHGHNHHQHGQHQYHHKQQRLPNPYQRKLSPPPPPPHPPSQSPSLASSITPPPAPLPPPKQQLGHQITELEQLERYYAKWPHLARVQFQIYDEHYRESHPDLYPDYEEDYETAAEMEEAQQEHGDEANLPPYIKKYNRRNKQLLNLLEGTLPPPSPPPSSISTKETRAGAVGGEIAPRLVWSKSVLQPGPHQSAPVATQPLAIHLDDDYLKQKRRRYHQQHREENLFAQQQQPRSSTTTMASPTTAGVTSTGLPNQLPEEDLEQAASPFDYWNSRAGIAAVGEAVRDGAETSPSTAKPALYKLPSYPAITSSFLGTPRSRSRSAQFVANVSGRGQSGWRQTDAIQSTMENNATMRPPPPPPAPPSSPLNSFVYHRVSDGGPDGSSLPSSAAFASSASLSSSSSSILSSRKQRLPFVAITDRRLETLGSKKLLAERHKDFEQNHFPLP